MSDLGSFFFILCSCVHKGVVDREPVLHHPAPLHLSKDPLAGAMWLATQQEVHEGELVDVEGEGDVPIAGHGAVRFLRHCAISRTQPSRPQPQICFYWYEPDL